MSEFMCNTSSDIIIRYFSSVASEDHVCICYYINLNVSIDIFNNDHLLKVFVFNCMQFGCGLVL